VAIKKGTRTARVKQRTIGRNTAWEQRGRKRGKEVESNRDRE